MLPRATESRLRVSCAALCRICGPDGRYLLGLNKNRLAQGREVYMPLGGALEYHAPDLPARFDATPEAPENRDLRLFMPEARLPAFRDWFLTRQERETSPLRELAEELADEFAVLAALKAEDVAARYLGTYEGESTSGRSMSIGAWTHYLHEIFDITFINPAITRALLHVPPASGLRWVNEDEILRGVTEVGTAVDGRALLLTY